MLHQNNKTMEYVHLIYVGSTIIGSGKTGQKYLLPKGDKYETLCFKKKLLGYETIGSVLKSETEDFHTFKNTQYGFKVGEKGAFTDLIDSVKDWTAEQIIFNKQKLLTAQAKKDHPDSVEGLVNSLISTTRHLPPRERKLFALWVYDKLV